MDPDIRWIVAQYGLSKNDTCLCVPETGRDELRRMGNELAGTTGLVAVYVPLGTEDVYQPGPLRGRVVGVARLLRMPSGARLEDYFCPDWDENPSNPEWDGTFRWPIGWPCEVVAAPLAAGPVLRDHVESLHGPGSFAGYAYQLKYGPVQLSAAMRGRLNQDFAS